MLIHTGSVAYPTATHYGSGTGLIFLSSIDCLGNETSLLECTYSPFHSCSHTLDVGVKCEGMAFHAQSVLIQGLKHFGTL